MASAERRAARRRRRRQDSRRSTSASICTTDYTLWSGLIGGLFLSLSYFGCDQSQVQRYLTAKSVDAGRHSLLVSAFVKIPLQALILLTGVLMFCFFLFNKDPMLFNPVYERTVLASQRAGEYRALEPEFDQTFEARAAAARGLAAAQSDPSSPAYATAREAFRSAQTRGRGRSRRRPSRWCGTSPATRPTRT